MPSPSTINRRRVVKLALSGTVTVGAGAGLIALGAKALVPTTDVGSRRLRALISGGPWLNTPALMPNDLRGKVVLVNFWTYSCINSLRPLPYVRNWAGKYRDRGLVVIGVHTPEFGFEKNLPNVRRALFELDVDYPVVLDSDSAIWRAFDNNAWPAFYFIDARGRVRGAVLGEERYDRSERLIQQLLSEATGVPVADQIQPVVGQGPQAAPDWTALKSEETYVGYTQATRFASPGGVNRNTAKLYRPAVWLAEGAWSLTGNWIVGGEFAALRSAPGAITYRFHARDLNLVLGPSASGRPIRFRVRLDGADPGRDNGVDIDAEGRGQVQAARMYQLIRQKRPVADRTFEIEFFDPDVQAYAFTFG